MRINIAGFFTLLPPFLPQLSELFRPLSLPQLQLSSVVTPFWHPYSSSTSFHPAKKFTTSKSLLPLIFTQKNINNISSCKHFMFIKKNSEKSSIV